MKLTAFFFGLFLFLQSQNSMAAFSNYNSILIGDQAAGMAGAYTALHSDASALAWYNPATLALLEGQSFSAAVGIYKKFDTQYGQAEDITKSALKVNQGFFRSLPSSTGSIVRYKDFLKEYLQEYTFALSIVTPEYDNYKGDVTSTSDHKTSLSVTDESLWVGVAVARKISYREAFGITFYYTARSYVRSIQDRTFQGTNQLKYYYVEDRAITQNSLITVLGYHYTFSPEWKLGVSLRLSDLQISGTGTYADSYFDSVSTTTTSNNLDIVKSKSHIPGKLTIGIAWERPNFLILSADITAYQPLSYNDIDDPRFAEKIENLAVYNTSFGAEYFFNDWLKFRGGVFTNYSSHPYPDISKTRGQGDRVNQFGFSANAALTSGNIQYTFGGYYTGGKGKSSQRIDQAIQLVDKTQHIFTMLVGTSYAF